LSPGRQAGPAKTLLGVASGGGRSVGSGGRGGGGSLAGVLSRGVGGLRVLLASLLVRAGLVLTGLDGHVVVFLGLFHAGLIGAGGENGGSGNAGGQNEVSDFAGVHSNSR